LKKHLLYFVSFVFFALIAINLYGDTLLGFEEQSLERVILEEYPLEFGGNIVLEQIGSSLYFRITSFRGGIEEKQTIRIIDMSSIINADEFTRIVNRIERIGRNITLNISRPCVDVWEYRHNRFGIINLAREFRPFKNFSEYTRHNITISGYTFIHYPKTIDGISAANVYDVPNNQGGNVYVRISYNGFSDNMTDEEFFEAARIQINALKNL